MSQTNTPLLVPVDRQQREDKDETDRIEQERQQTENEQETEEIEDEKQE